MRVEPVLRIKMEGEFKWRGGKLLGGRAQMISLIDQRIQKKKKKSRRGNCAGI